MNNFPLVSIAAINYNNPEYLIETLESIKAQTYPNIELVIVDDYSTTDDVSLISEWLKSYTGKHKFIRHSENKGVCAAYNSGLFNATGKYFTVIDTDDIMLPEKTVKQLAFLEGTDDTVAAVYSDAYVIDASGNPLDGLFIQRHRQFKEIPSGNIYESLLGGNYIPCMTFFGKTAVFQDIGGYDETLSYEDYDMWLRVAKKYRILFSDFVACKYRIRQGSLSSTNKKWNLSDTKIFLKHVGAALPMERIRKIMWDVYIGGDTETMPFITELGIKTRDRYMIAVPLLWQYGFAPGMREKILNRIKDSIADGVPELVAGTGEQELLEFNRVVVPALGDNMLYGLVKEIYHGGEGKLLDLIKELANDRNDKWLLAAYLLGRYHIPDDLSNTILDIISRQAQSNNNITRSSGSTDAALFMHNIYPFVPAELLKRIAYSAYITQDAGQLSLVGQFAKKAGDRYIKTIWLLWKYNIRVVVGTIIAARIEGYCRAGKSNFYIDVRIYKDIFEALLRYNKPLEGN